MPDSMQLVVWAPKRVCDCRTEHGIQVGLGPQGQGLQEEVMEDAPYSIGHQAPVKPFTKTVKCIANYEWVLKNQIKIKGSTYMSGLN